MGDDPKLYGHHSYPTVNFIGNKEKITHWICDNIPKGVESVFDAFSGGSSVAYFIKQYGKTVYANDIMRINYIIAKAIIENASQTLDQADVQHIFSGKPFEGFVFKHYASKLFFADECKELDLYRKNIESLSNDYKRALALTLMRRAMIRKMPYSRFNIAWDKVKQLRDEDYSYRLYKRKRAYHNQSFEHHFVGSLSEYNQAVFDNGQPNKAYNEDTLQLVKKVKADLIYLDPPYTGTMNNYYGFYNFLDNYVDQKMHEPFSNNFISKADSLDLFDALFANLQNYKYWMLSYNSASYPTKDQLLDIISRYARSVKVVEIKHNYKITGKAKKDTNTEYLFIAERK